MQLLQLRSAAEQCYSERKTRNFRSSSVAWQSTTRRVSKTCAKTCNSKNKKVARHNRRAVAVKTIQFNRVLNPVATLTGIPSSVANDEQSVRIYRWVSVGN